MGRRVALASLLLSAVLATMKIWVGLVAGSTAVVSDGFESAGDVFASGFVLVGLTLAEKPPDEEHPYGHGRFELLSGLLVGILLAATGALIAYHALEHVWTEQKPPRAFAVWPMAVSIVVKSVTWWFKRIYGQRIGSDSLVADSWNDAMDILSAMVALVALILTLAEPARFAAADAIGGFFVGLIVIGLGLHVVRDTTLHLVDTMPPPDLLKQIRTVALGVSGAQDVEKCFARKTGLKYHVDLHLEVDPEMTVRDSHEVASAVRARIRQKLDWVADVLVHVEPHG